MTKRFVLRTFVILSLFWMACFFLCYANPIATYPVQVEPNSVANVSLDLTRDYKLTGGFYVENETNPSVVFSIIAPSGKIVVSLGAMQGGLRHFELTTEESGNYTLEFKNAHEPSSRQTVELYYSVTGPYFFGVQSDMLIAVVATAFLIVLIVSAMTFLVWKWHKRKTTAT